MSISVYVLLSIPFAHVRSWINFTIWRTCSRSCVLFSGRKVKVEVHTDSLIFRIGAYPVSQKTGYHTILLPITLPSDDQFPKFFYCGLSSKRTMKWSLKIQPQLKRIGILPRKRNDSFNNKFKLNLNVLTNLCHSEYSKCPGEVCAAGQWHRQSRSVSLQSTH